MDRCPSWIPSAAPAPCCWRPPPPPSATPQACGPHRSWAERQQAMARRSVAPRRRATARWATSRRSALRPPAARRRRAPSASSAGRISTLDSGGGRWRPPPPRRARLGPTAHPWPPWSASNRIRPCWPRPAPMPPPRAWRSTSGSSRAISAISARRPGPASWCVTRPTATASAGATISKLSTPTWAGWCGNAAAAGPSGC